MTCEYYTRIIHALPTPSTRGSQYYQKDLCNSRKGDKKPANLYGLDDLTKQSPTNFPTMRYNIIYS